MDFLERHSTYLDWITLVFLGCIILMTIAKLLFPKRFESFIYLPLTTKYFLVQGKNDELTHGFNVLLFIVQLLSISFFIYLFLVEIGYGKEQRPWLLYIQICSLYFVFIGFKLSVEKIIGNVFNMERIMNFYLYQKLTYKNYIGILILICNILMVYSFGNNKTGLLVIIAISAILNGIGLLLSLKTFRSIIIPNFLYFILYLCALEIAPYIILYKAVI